MKSHALCFALLSAAAIVASVPAQAQNGSLTRSFVSSAGSDSNACTITAPCATFAHAYTVIGANGIIAALDPGKYGPLNITGPVTVNGNGWAAITGLAAGNGITVTAGTGNVILTGLEVDGAGAAYNGIVFNTGGSLTISNCVVKDFVTNNGDTSGATGNGIWIAPTSSAVNFTIVNTTAVNNQWSGIGYGASSGTTVATGAIDHIVATNNGYAGISVYQYPQSVGSVAIDISHSVASNNQTGILSAGSDLVALTVDAGEINNNIEGVSASNGSMLLSRSVITKNLVWGVFNPYSGIFSTYDNRIYANGNDNAIFGTAVNPVSLK